MRRDHYERAFAHFLRLRRIPFASVDDARRALAPRAGVRRPAASGLGQAAVEGAHSIKSFDFVLYGVRPDGSDAGLFAPRHLLAEVKGRRLANLRTASATRRLECWVTDGDIRSLGAWEELFGQGFAAAFCFVYWCCAEPPGALFQDVFEHEGRWYAIRTVLREDYLSACRRRSERWKTLDLPQEDFCRLSHPLTHAGEACTPPAGPPLGGRNHRPAPAEGLACR